LGVPRVKRYYNETVVARLAAKPQIGIQMYTFRDLTKDDLLGTLKEVAKIGYQAVEFAGFFGHSAAEVRKVLDDNGLKAPSAHIPVNFTEPDKMESELAQHIEYAKEVGLEYVITPWAPFPEVPSEADVENFIGIIDKASQMVTAAGLKYGYHNHDFEFKTVGGKTIMDHLLQRIPAERLIAEFDLGWVHVAGHSPVEYLKAYQGRTPLAHFKDFVEGRKDTEIGKGSVDFDSVLKITEEAGIQYIIVEQEQFASSPLESAAISLEYFKERGLL
jgi:sugar phosphate isomerase/epimerase